MKVKSQIAQRDASAPSQSGVSVVSAVRVAGRVALWVAVAVIMVRGISATLTGDPRGDSRAAVRSRPASRVLAAESSAFAVGFARAYLPWWPGEAAAHARRVARFAAAELRDRAAAELPRRGTGQQVAQATVARSQDLGSGRALITVAAELADGRTLYLSVPVARDGRGGLDVFALPALSAPPPAGTAAAAVAQPLTGAPAAEIRALVARFLATYLSGGAPGRLSYLVAPGTVIAGIPPGLELRSVDGVQRMSMGARRMLVAVDVRVGDRATRASYPLSYRLELTRTDRWYVAGVQGGPRS